MIPVGFEPTISAGERPHTHALDRAATGTGFVTTVSDIHIVKQELIILCNVSGNVDRVYRSQASRRNHERRSYLVGNQ